MRIYYKTDFRGNKGQALLISILVLGGAMLGATTLAGLLMLYQIRATTDSEHSAQAIFAADAGVNWLVYNYGAASSSQLALPGSPPGTLSDGATLTVSCSDSGSQPTSCTSTVATAISEGISNGSRRAFSVDFTAGVGPLP